MTNELSEKRKNEIRKLIGDSALIFEFCITHILRVTRINMILLLCSKVQCAKLHPVWF